MVVIIVIDTRFQETHSLRPGCPAGHGPEAGDAAT